MISRLNALLLPWIVIPEPIPRDEPDRVISIFICTISAPSVAFIVVVACMRYTNENGSVAPIVILVGVPALHSEFLYLPRQGIAGKINTLMIPAFRCFHQTKIEILFVYANKYFRCGLRITFLLDLHHGIVPCTGLPFTINISL